MSKQREEQRAKSRRGRRNRQRGDESERDVAEQLREIKGYETVRRRLRVQYGPPQSDLTDEATGKCIEVKSWQSHPAKLEDAYQQSCGYAETRHDGPTPMVIAVDCPGPGAGHRKQYRAYYDFKDWKREQQELASLRALVSAMEQAAQPLVEAFREDGHDEAHIDGEDVELFLLTFSNLKGARQ